MGNWRDAHARAYEVTIEEWESRCHWDDLTPEEKALCCDGGCGLTLWGWFKPLPDFNFREACCRHDFHYLRGGSERVRKLGDRNFQEEVIKLAEVSDIPRVQGHWARLYAACVIKYGYLAWRYGPMRTKQEILELAKKV